MQEEFFMNSMEHDPKLSDDLMYDSLVKLKPLENPKKNPMQNALRKYYYYRNGKEFPRLNSYQR